MKQVILSVYDSRVQVWSQPTFVLNRGSALRAWEGASNDPDSPFSKHPSEFTAFIIGEWDDETGLVQTYPVKEPLGTALEFRNVTRPTQPQLIESQVQQ